MNIPPSTPPESPAASRSRRRADLVLRTGVVVTAIGLVVSLLALLPLVIPDWNPPGWLWFASMIVGVGLFIVIVGLVLASRGRRARP
jgi:threonine/homoserine/homoserine lactone efflux protein